MSQLGEHKENPEKPILQRQSVVLDGWVSPMMPMAGWKEFRDLS